MKRSTFHLLVTVVAVLSIAAGKAEAQSVTSNSISFRVEDVTEMFMPPDLRLNIQFIDANRNNILEAEETGIIRLSISNKGGDAGQVKVSVKPQNSFGGLKIEKNEFITSVEQNSTSVIDVPVQAAIDINTGSSRLDIVASEPMGYDIKAMLEVSTFEFQKAKIKISGVEISDSGKGLKAYNNNPDNKLQNQDVAMASVTLQNIGQGEARNIQYKIVSQDPNIRFLTMSGYADSISGNLDDLLVGQTGKIDFRITPNAHYKHKGEYVPVFLTLSESKGFANLNNVQIPLPFDAAAVAPKVIKVEGDREKLMASLGTKVYSEDSRVTSDSRIKDLMVIPTGEAIYSKAIAVVIGTEKYQDKNIPAAPYAERDAIVMAEYFRKALGIKDVRLMTNSQVTNMELKKTFDSSKGKLRNAIVPGETDLFIYYSGHGVPMENAEGRKDIFLVPYDVDRDWIRDEGFSLNKLYADLGNLRAKSVTVILDACFSGGTRSSEAYSSKSIANQKLVIPDYSDMEQPWVYDSNFRVFTSSRGDQASLGYDRSQSGLFTYFLAVGLQGDADKDGNGKVTMRELVDFVGENVNKNSEGRQSPQFFGNADFVIEKIQ